MQHARCRATWRAVVAAAAALLRSVCASRSQDSHFNWQQVVLARPNECFAGVLSGQFQAYMTDKARVSYAPERTKWCCDALDIRSHSP